MKNKLTPDQLKVLKEIAHVGKAEDGNEYLKLMCVMRFEEKEALEMDKNAYFAKVADTLTGAVHDMVRQLQAASTALKDNEQYREDTKN